jgi:hypothetical protein
MSKSCTTIGERIQDYFVYLNYDKLASPNYMFGIYDGLIVDRNTTPLAAIPVLSDLEKSIVTGSKITLCPGQVRIWLLHDLIEQYFWQPMLLLVACIQEMNTLRQQLKEIVIKQS